MIKKYLIFIPIILLASACSKQPVVSNNQNLQPQNQQVASSSPAQPAATSTPTKSGTSPVPLTESVYNNAAQHFKVLYLNYFSLFSGAKVKANNTKGINFSACVPYGLNPDLCFLLNSQPYQNTNLSSAGVAVTVLKNKTTIGDCGTFSTKDLNGGKVTDSVRGNGVVFVTAVSTDAGAGNFSETHFNRAFYGTICYEIDETVRWTNAQNYSPAKAEFDKADVWSKLDVLRNGFQFVK